MHLQLNNLVDFLFAISTCNFWTMLANIVNCGDNSDSSLYDSLPQNSPFSTFFYFFLFCVIALQDLFEVSWSAGKTKCMDRRIKFYAFFCSSFGSYHQGAYFSVWPVHLFFFSFSFSFPFYLLF